MKAVKTVTHELFTERFVVLGTYEIGSVKIGYGETLEAARADSVLPESFGKRVSEEIHTRTEMTKVVGRRTYAVYVVS